jgi:hypothetical protein
MKIMAIAEVMPRRFVLSVCFALPGMIIRSSKTKAQPVRRPQMARAREGHTATSNTSHLASTGQPARNHVRGGASVNLGKADRAPLTHRVIGPCPQTRRTAETGSAVRRFIHVFARLRLGSSRRVALRCRVISPSC